ncbi:Alpha/Beta hydrolase protein [Elsinoe ampelina]|uniref:Alpha/Beta hydrolase protein n=1 Tax=Elsinoe ampelina TaxID=302913 RepID=A0A6A6GM99_9PEZI|nr:Alpha/Beta hydrolase protein [Elsinoe ampelina]
MWEWFLDLFAGFYAGNTTASASREVDNGLDRRQATSIAHALRIEDWPFIRQRFVAPLRRLLLDSLFAKGFDFIRLTAGPLVDVEDPVITQGWWTTTVILPMQFKRARLAARITMLPSGGGLIGFRVHPEHTLGLGPKWQAPLYDSPTLYKEEHLALDAGGYKVKAVMTTPTTTQQYPCTIILSGSGPCDVDSTVGPNKPLKDLSVGLAKCNVASIRFEKVTFAHGISIRNRKGFTLTEEYVPHALAAVRHAGRHPHVNDETIVLVGHSLGAYITAKLASMDDSIRKCVLLACPIRPIYHSAIKQFEYFAAMDDPSGQQVQPQIEELRKQAELADSPHLTGTTSPKDLPFGLGPAYWLDCRNYNPLQDITSCRKPVFCLQGGRDYQVTREDVDTFIDLAKDNPLLKCISYEDLNHLFISGMSPSTPLECETLGNVDEAVILDIARWCHDDSVDVAALFRRP